MEINLNVKVKGGPRTPVSVTVYGTAVNSKTLQFKNGNTVHEDTIAEWLMENLTIALRKIQDEQK